MLEESCIHSVSGSKQMQSLHQLFKFMRAFTFPQPPTINYTKRWNLLSPVHFISENWWLQPRLMMRRSLYSSFWFCPFILAFTKPAIFFQQGLNCHFWWLTTGVNLTYGTTCCVMSRFAARAFCCGVLIQLPTSRFTARLSGFSRLDLVDFT